jgi:hypothetical protein
VASKNNIEKDAYQCPGFVSQRSSCLQDDAIDILIAFCSVMRAAWKILVRATFF